jgi:DNA polymerase-3 subunit gamma/tau
MLLSQQAQLVRLDANRAVVQVAGNWMGMVQSRASLLEQAVAKALGGSRQLVLEASNPAMPPPLATAPVATAPAAVEPPSPAPAPTPAPTATPASAPVPTPELPQTQAQPLDANPAAAPAESSPQPSPPSGLDRQARNLADFFNGQVLDVDDVN